MGDADLSRFLQTMIRGTGNALAGPSVIAGRGCAQPKRPTNPTSSRRQARMVSERPPVLHCPVRRPGALPPPPGEFRIVELAGCNSAVLRETVMARLLHELLLLSCVAAFAIGVVIAAQGEREAAGGHCLGGRLAPQGRRIMQQRLYWLDYDPVAFAVLVIGMGMIGLLTLFI
jgi:hypothetical protein